MADLARTPLFDWHAAHRGKLVDFAGWSMPVQYGSIVDEHRATRTACGIFDVSHMGRLRFDGPAAGPFLDGLLTRGALRVPPGRVRYSLIVNDAGGILDDVLVYHLTDGSGRAWYELVVNAGNRAKIVAWLEAHGGQSPDVGLVDRTLATAMIAVQGPQALQLVARQLAPDVDLAAFKYYAAAPVRLAGRPAVVGRTGYTGEDGVELVVPASDAASVWEALVAGGATAAGLGARDTLRLEAAMPLYGHELTESIDPYMADLGFAVELADRQFVGCQALARLKPQTDRQRRIGLAMSGKRVPREGYGVWVDEQLVGQVTSGTFSPTFERPIAMAYVRPEHAAPGTSLHVDVRGSREMAQVVPLPFYKRNSSS